MVPVHVLNHEMLLDKLFVVVPINCKCPVKSNHGRP